MKALTARKQTGPVSGSAAKAQPPSGWRRPQTDQSMTEELGRRLRVIREDKGLSLAQLGELCGVPTASLSRIENNKMSPTFGVLSRVMMGLDIDWTDVVGRRRLAPGEKLVSFAGPGEGQASNVRQSKANVLHSHEAAHLLPLIADVHARNVEEAGGLNGHKGEEFCYVLSGTLVLHLEGMPPRTMKAGASALFDSATPHAYLAGTAAGARIMIVVLRAYGSSPGSDRAPAPDRT